MVVFVFLEESRDAGMEVFVFGGKQGWKSLFLVHMDDGSPCCFGEEIMDGSRCFLEESMDGSLCFLEENKDGSRCFFLEENMDGWMSCCWIVGEAWMQGGIFL